MELIVRSTVIHWPERLLEVTDTDGEKHTLPLNKNITVTMVGFPEREVQTMVAHKLGGYISRGYIIEKIVIEEE